MKHKILIGSVIVVVLITIPISSAVAINANVDNEIKENTETKALELDNDREVFSIIYGDCYSFKRIPKSLFLSAEIKAGWCFPADTSFWIAGLRRPLLNPNKSQFGVETEYAYVHCFIGFHYPMIVHYRIFGIALGNIDYEV